MSESQINKGLGIYQINSQTVDDLTVQNLTTVNLYIPMTTTITVDILSYMSVNMGKQCYISVLDTNDGSIFATASGYIDPNITATEYGLVAVTQLSGTATVSAALFAGQKYGLKIDSAGTHLFEIRILVL